MSVTSQDPQRQFLSSLIMPEPNVALLQTAEQVAQPDKTASASVAGNALLAFTADVSSQHKNDLLNSIGMAQLATVAKHINAVTDPIGYYTNVTTILTNIGYTAQSINFSNYSTTTKTVEIDRVVLEIMANLVTAPELAIVKAAVNALKSSADANGAPWSIYNSKSTSSNNGSFSIGLANETNNSVAVKLSAFHFQGTETSTKFLWMSYSATSVKIQNGQTTLVLNEEVYAGIRAAVVQKMSSHAAGYIANLPSL